MNTWQMIKELTETKSTFGEVFYGAVHKDEGIKICYLRPDAGSIEFRYFDFISKKLTMLPVLYNEETWMALPPDTAKKYLDKRIDAVLVEG